MKIISTIEELYSGEPTATAIGKFDGVHAGHRKLLDVILKAKTEGLKAAVFTFEPPPEALFGMGDVKVLTTREEKRRLLKELGIDLLIEYPMDRQTAAVEPEDFIREYLVRRLRVRMIAAGADLSYGKAGKGDFALMDRMKDECGYRSVCVEKLCVDNSIVSSSRIRELIAKGRMGEAAAMLGRTYRLSGTVAHGRGLGHTIGFPTVNIYPPADKVLPPFGVYRSRVILREDESGRDELTRPEDAMQTDRTDPDDVTQGQRKSPIRVLNGITNIGVRPTVSEESRISAETYLYDFDEDLYGRKITVELISFERPEMRFENVDALRAQLQRDITAGYSQLKAEMINSRP